MATEFVDEEELLILLTHEQSALLELLRRKEVGPRLPSRSPREHPKPGTRPPETSRAHDIAARWALEP